MKSSATTSRSSAPGAVPLEAERVVAITVTYGNRMPLLQRCIAALETQRIGRLIVVTNGIGAAYRRQLDDARMKADLPIDLVHLPRNIGAAGGFAAGIAYTRSHHGESYLWFLDDDNCPVPGAIAALAEAATTHDLVAELVALSGLRRGRFPLWLRAAQTGQGDGVFYRRSSISTLDIRMIPDWVRRKFGKRAGRPVPDADAGGLHAMVDIPGAPFGGFFLHSSHVDTIGMPDARYVLYFDDLEWTNRIRRHGGTLYLVSQCAIEDAEGDWTGAGVAGTPSRFFLIDLLEGNNAQRLYFSIRNNVYFKSRYWSDGWLITVANVALLIVLALLLGLRLHRFGSASTLTRAAFDGLFGRLGGSL